MAGGSSAGLDGGRITFHDLPTVVVGGPLTEGTEWLNAEARILRDRSSNEFLAFRWFESVNRVAMIASADGIAWRVVSTGPTPNAACVGQCSLFPAKVMSVVQDASGAVHALIGANDFSGPLREYYARITLSHATNGTLNGYQLDAVTPLPPHGRSTNILSDLRGDLGLIDFDGTQVLAYVMNVTTVSGVSTGDIKSFVGRSTSLRPNAASDFVSLSGTAGDTLVFDSCSFGSPYCTAFPAFFSTHNMTGKLAQLPQSKDLYFFVGPIEADYGYAGNLPGQPEASKLRMKRLAWSSTNRTWSNQATPVVLADSDGSYLPLLLDVASAPDAVWLLSLDPVTGVHVGKVDVGGQFHDSATLLSVRHYSGWGVLNVSPTGQRAWAIWNLCTSDNSTPAVDCLLPRTAQSRWNGTQWEIFDDPIPSGDHSGLGKSAGWERGVAAILYRGTLLRPNPPVPQFSAIGD